MKKRISLIVTILFITTITTAFAMENLRISISESKTLATANSKQATVDDLTITTKESALKDAEKEANKSTGANAKIDKLNNRIAKEVTTVKAAADLEYAKRIKEENIKKLELDVYKASSNVLLIKKELEAEKGKQDILDEKYKMAEVRLREGKLTENDLNDAKYALDLKAIDVNKITKKLEAANLELKRVLGVEMNTDPIEIKDTLSLVSRIKVDIDRVVENAINNDTDLFIKSEELKASEKTMEITKEYYEQGTVTYDGNMLNLENSKVAYEDAKINLEVAIRNKYNDVLTALDKVDLAYKWQTINKNKLDSVQFKFEKGLVSKEEVLNAKEKYLDAQYQTFLAVYNYNTVKAEFDTLYVK